MLPSRSVSVQTSVFIFAFFKEILTSSDVANMMLFICTSSNRMVSSDLGFASKEGFFNHDISST